MKQFFKDNQLVFFSLVGSIIFLIFIFFLFEYFQNRPGKYDDFAKCLKEKKAVFYGAFWCPHCQNQKRIFGASAKYLPYVECSTADGEGQLEVCQKKKITSYPTWEFADGTRITGEATIEQLAKKTGCLITEKK